MSQVLEDIKSEITEDGNKEPCAVKGCDKVPTEKIELYGAKTIKFYLCHEIHFPIIASLGSRNTAALLIQLKKWGVYL